MFVDGVEEDGVDLVFSDTFVRISRVGGLLPVVSGAKWNPREGATSPQFGDVTAPPRSGPLALDADELHRRRCSSGGGAGAGGVSGTIDLNLTDTHVPLLSPVHRGCIALRPPRGLSRRPWVASAPMVLFALCVLALSMVLFCEILGVRAKVRETGVHAVAETGAATTGSWAHGAEVLPRDWDARVAVGRGRRGDAGDRRTEAKAAKRATPRVHATMVCLVRHGDESGERAPWAMHTMAVVSAAFCGIVFGSYVVLAATSMDQGAARAAVTLRFLAQYFRSNRLLATCALAKMAVTVTRLVVARGAANLPSFIFVVLWIVAQPAIDLWSLLSPPWATRFATYMCAAAVAVLVADVTCAEAMCARYHSIGDQLLTFANLAVMSTASLNIAQQLWGKIRSQGCRRPTLLLSSTDNFVCDM